MKRRLLLAGPLALLGGAAAAQSARAAPLKVHLVAEAFPPLQYADAQGQPHGTAHDLAVAALALAGAQLPLEVAALQFVPLQRALMMAASQPDTLVLSIARTPEREQRLRWIAPIAPYELWLYRLRSSEPLPASFDALRGHGLRFGAQLRSNFHEWLLRQGLGTAPDNSVIDTVARNNLNFLKSRAGRIDYFAHPSISFTYRAAEQGLRPADFEPVLRIDELSMPLWAATGPDSDERLVAALMRAFAELQQSGRAARLHEQSMRQFNTLHRLEGG
ncbi:substrate-binding periplasmic protein [Aquabacterium humicola]|uniref:substrate-binding periplasmic protein n=1 Tax=Aquabacterium humicola TaxID=3237377 RepID=UPI0025437398|nr:ABC transporter substrate-binding protein [Rubrivivax pictus]